jgi:glycosyltransferase involved in cell wall biosynthesis
VRIAWFSPLPPLQSGISDYSAELLPAIAAQADVDVYCPRPALGPLSPHGVRPPEGTELFRPSVFARRADRYGAVFYHLANNPFHRFVYEAYMERPGVAVFHEFVLHHLIAHMTVEQPVKRRLLSRYVELMESEHGEAGRRLAELRWTGVASEFEKFIFPLNAHVARRASALVSHNLDVADRLSRIAPDVPVTVIPHHAGRPPAGVARLTRDDARRRLNLPSSAFLVGHFGFITLPKQPAAVVGGFARLAARDPNALLLVVGADRSGGGLTRLLRRRGVEGQVRLTGFVDLSTFYLYLKAVDAVVNIRYPSAGESSGTFARALAEGRATIVNNVGSFAEVPSDVALKVEIDGDQAEEVGSHLIHLAGDPAYRIGIEERARAYAREFLDPNRCAALYLQVALQVAGLEPVGS